MRETDIPALTKQLFPVALLYLGDRDEAVSAITEALTAAAKSGGENALSALLRICSTRAGEQTDAALFPEDALLQSVMRLPAGSRRDLALHFSGIPDEEAAKVRGITGEQYAQKLDKALRQLNFLQNGGTADPEALSASIGQIALTSAETAGIRRRWTVAAEKQQTAQQAAAEKPPVREIVRRDSEPQQKPKLPIWGVLLSALCIVLTIAVAALLIDRSRLSRGRTLQPHTEAESSAEDYTVQDLSHLNYIGMDAARTAVLHDLGVDAAEVTFTNTRLDTAKNPVCYKLTCIDGNSAQYDYSVDAVSGEILKRTNSEAMRLPDTTDWIALDEARSRALRYTKLTAALTIREQLGEDGGRGYYKFEFQDEDGKIYAVQLSATSGILLKYSIERPQKNDTSGFVPIETAKQQAVSRVGDLTPEQVIFTKEKLDGAVYLFAFTLDDGTQYALELDAKTGMTNTLDVHPVSGDTSQAIGLLKARDIALEYAAIAAEDVMQYTKAKIDRSNGAYVYELEFESADYEYVAVLDINSGEIVKFKAQYK